MAFKIEFLPEADNDFDSLDGSLKKQAARKIEALGENPLLGDPLGNRMGIDLTGFYKLYFAKKKYRIVYRIDHNRIEVIEIIGIGRRDKAKIYKAVAKRIVKLK